MPTEFDRPADTAVDQALAHSYTHNRPMTLVIAATPHEMNRVAAPATHVVLRIHKDSSAFSQVQQMFPQIKDPGVYRVERGQVQKYEDSEPAPSSVPIAPKCTIAVRLLNGSSVRHQFKECDALATVRGWLDQNEDFTVLPTTAMPSFASPDCLHPTDYEFTSPTIPRVTYTREQEQATLKELGLCPRSVLTLNPIYSEPLNHKKRGIIRQTADLAAGFAHVLYSFFDYGMELSELETESYKEAHFVDVPNEALKIPKTTPNEDDFQPLQAKAEASTDPSVIAASGSTPKNTTGFDISRASSPVQAMPVASRVQTIQKEAEELN